MDEKTPRKHHGRPKGAKDKKPRKPVVRRLETLSKKRAETVPAWNDGVLTPGQAKFVAEYLVDKNATQAAIRAGVGGKNPGVYGCQLLATRKIKEAIRGALDAQMVRTSVTADMVIHKLAAIAFGDSRKVMSWGPEGLILKDSESLPDEAALLVSEVSETKGTDKGGGSLKIKTHDSLKALELLGRHFGIFQDNVTARVQSQDMGKATQEQQEKFAALTTRALDRWAAMGYPVASKE